MAKSKLPVAMPDAPRATSDVDMKWKAKDALQTIKRAEEIRSDKALFKMVKQCAREEMKALKKL